MSLPADLYWRVHPPERPFDPEDATSTPFHGPHPTQMGYSAFANPWHLFLYLDANHLYMQALHQQIIGFTGTSVGTGADGEDLVLPDMRTVRRFAMAEWEAQLATTPLPDSPKFSEVWTGRNNDYLSWAKTKAMFQDEEHGFTLGGDPVIDVILKAAAGQQLYFHIGRPGLGVGTELIPGGPGGRSRLHTGPVRDEEMLDWVWLSQDAETAVGYALYALTHFDTAVAIYLARPNDRVEDRTGFHSGSDAPQKITKSATVVAQFPLAYEAFRTFDWTSWWLNAHPEGRGLPNSYQIQYDVLEQWRSAISQGIPLELPGIGVVARKTAAWRDQSVEVRGQDRRLGEVQGGALYHGSTVDLPNGTVLEPGHGRNFADSDDNAVSVTSNPQTALYWAREINPAGPHFIYEVEPLGDVDGWRVTLANYGQNIELIEGRVPRARIVRRVDNSKTAAWRDVRNKAREIRSGGGVKVIAYTGDTITAEVRSTTGSVYQTSLLREPGTKSVAMWECTCAWSAYSWGRSGRWRKYEGRMCAHALALVYEAQAQEWGGNNVTEGEGHGEEITFYEAPPIEEWRMDTPTAPRSGGDDLGRAASRHTAVATGEKGVRVWRGFLTWSIYGPDDRPPAERVEQSDHDLPQNRALAQRFHDGTVTAADLLKIVALDSAGLYWAEAGPHPSEGGRTGEEVARSYAGGQRGYVPGHGGVDETQLLAYSWDERGPSGTQWEHEYIRRGIGTAMIVLVAELAEDAAGFDGEGMLELDEGQQLNLLEIQYNAGWGWHTVPIGGRRITAAKTAYRYQELYKSASASAIYRGLKVDLPRDVHERLVKLTQGALEESEIGQERQVGALLVDFLQAHHWDSEMGLGRHWSTRKEMAETAAWQGATSGVGIVLTATYDPADEDLVYAEAHPAFRAAESEITLRPGARVTITNVELINWPDSQHMDLIDGPISATAGRSLLDEAFLFEASAPKDPRFEGVAMGEDDDGVYVHTHRARSDSYPGPEHIPQSVVDYIESTGSRKTAASGIMYHLTDDVNFRLDPDFHPENNTTWGGDWPHAGIFLGGSVESWVNGYGYWRPWVVEFDTSAVDFTAEHAMGGGGYSGEVFVPADQFDRLRLVRVVPLDAHCREEFGDYGWTERDTGLTFDTFEPIPAEDENNYFKWRGYHYPGDARQADAAWRDAYKKRVKKHGRSHPGAIASKQATRGIPFSDMWESTAIVFWIAAGLPEGVGSFASNFPNNLPMAYQKMSFQETTDWPGFLNRLTLAAKDSVFVRDHGDRLQEFYLCAEGRGPVGKSEQWVIGQTDYEGFWRAEPWGTPTRKLRGGYSRDWEVNTQFLNHAFYDSPEAFRKYLAEELAGVSIDDSMFAGVSNTEPTVVYRGISLPVGMDPLNSTTDRHEGVGHSWSLDFDAACRMAERNGAGFNSDNRTVDGYLFNAIRNDDYVPTVLRATVIIDGGTIDTYRPWTIDYASEQEVDIPTGTPITIDGYMQARPIIVSPAQYERAKLAEDRYSPEGYYLVRFDWPSSFSGANKRTIAMRTTAARNNPFGMVIDAATGLPHLHGQPVFIYPTWDPVAGIADFIAENGELGDFTAAHESTVIRRGVVLNVGGDLEQARRLADGNVSAQDILRFFDNGRVGEWWFTDSAMDLVDVQINYADVEDQDPLTEALKEADQAQDPDWWFHQMGAASGEDWFRQRNMPVPPPEVMYANPYTWTGGDIGVVLEARTPTINGQLWDPETDNPSNGLMGNSYLPVGHQIELLKVHYNPGNGWRTLPAEGLRVTAAKTAGLFPIEEDWATEAESGTSNWHNGIYSGVLDADAVGYRAMGDIEELRSAFAQGSWQSEKRFTLGFEGATHFTSDPNEVINFNGAKVIVEVDLHGLPFKVIQPPVEQGGQWFVNGDRGEGLGVEGDIPARRILRVGVIKGGAIEWHEPYDFLDPDGPGWAHFAGKKISPTAVQHTWQTIPGLTFEVKRNTVSAYTPESKANSIAIGRIYWYPTGEISQINVQGKYQRMGLGAELVRRAKEVKPELHHSTTLSDDGREFSRALQARLRTAQIEAADPMAGLKDVLETIDSKEHTHSGLIIKAIDSGRVLMTQRTPYAEDPDGVYGTYEFPGGGIDDQEDAFTSALREFREETGLELPEDWAVEGCYESGKYLGIIILVPHEAWTTNASLLSHEVMGLGWFNPDHIEDAEWARDEVRDGTDWALVKAASPTAIVRPTADETLPGPIGFDLGVLGRVRVPLWAVGLRDVERAEGSASQDVLASWDLLEMGRLHAEAMAAGDPAGAVESDVVARVVEHVAGRDGIAQQDPDQPVHLPRSSLEADLAVAATAGWAGPQVAGVPFAHEDAAGDLWRDLAFVGGIAGHEADRSSGPDGAEATLHDVPEPALPTTDGSLEEVEDLFSPAAIAQRTAALGEDDSDIAAAANAYLAKTAVKVFSPKEQMDLIEEGAVEGVTAANLDRLDIEGTHYEALEERYRYLDADPEELFL